MGGDVSASPRVTGPVRAPGRPRSTEASSPPSASPASPSSARVRVNARPTRGGRQPRRGGSSPGWRRSRRRRGRRRGAPAGSSISVPRRAGHDLARSSGAPARRPRPRRSCRAGSASRRGPAEGGMRGDLVTAHRRGAAGPRGRSSRRGGRRPGHVRRGACPRAPPPPPAMRASGTARKVTADAAITSCQRRRGRPRARPARRSDDSHARPRGCRAPARSRLRASDEAARPLPMKPTGELRRLGRPPVRRPGVRGRVSQPGHGRGPSRSFDPSGGSPFLLIRGQCGLRTGVLLRQKPKRRLYAAGAYAVDPDPRC